MSDPDILIKAGVWSPQKVKRLLMQSQSYYLDRRIGEVEQALRSIAADPLTLSLLSQSLSSLRSEQQELSNAIQTERKSRLESEDSSSAFFCSHSVAVVLRSLGVLPSSVPATEYLPYSFSSEMNLPLLKGATFSGEVFLRGTKNDVFASTGKIVDELYATMVKRKNEEEEKEEKENERNGKQLDLNGNGNGNGSEAVDSSGNSEVNIEDDNRNHSKENQNQNQNNNELINHEIETEENPTLLHSPSHSSSSNHPPAGSPPPPPTTSLESVSVPHRDVTSLLSPSDLSYVLTQLRLTRPLARSSDASLLALLQHMAMYSPQLSAH